MFEFDVKTGFQLHSLDKVIEDIKEEFRGKIDQNLNLSEGSLMGDSINLLSDRLHSVSSLIPMVLDSVNPDNSEGVFLDRISSLNETYRLDATSTIIQADVTSSKKIELEKGFKCFDKNGEIFEFIGYTNEMAVLKSEFAGVKNFEFKDNSIANFKTKIDGLISFDNVQIVERGKDIEKDEDFNLRRKLDVYKKSSSTSPAIKLELERLKFIRKALLFSDKNEIVIDLKEGYKGDSIEIRNEIAEIIYNRCVSFGVVIFGMEKQKITDKDGFNHFIRWSYTNKIYCNLMVKITVNERFKESQKDIILQSFLDEINSYELGRDVFVNPYQYGVLAGFEGIISAEILIKKDGEKEYSNQILVQKSEKVAIKMEDIILEIRSQNRA